MKFYESFLRLQNTYVTELQNANISNFLRAQQTAALKVKIYGLEVLFSTLKL